jgi:hypothetical protein
MVGSCYLHKSGADLVLSPLNGSIAFINGTEIIYTPDGQFPPSAVPIPLVYAVDSLRSPLM